MTKIQTNILWTFASINFILLFILPVNTFYWADDYAFINDLNKHGLLQNCLNGYINWDGRSLSLASVIQGFLLKYCHVEFTTFFWTACFLTSGMLILPCVGDELSIIKTSKRKQLLMAMIVAIGLWLGAFSHFSETIYWATGGFYSFSLLLGATWVFYFIKLQQAKIAVAGKILMFAFSIIVGGTTQNLSFALLTLISIYLLHDFTNKVKTNLQFNLVLFTGILIGLIFILVAPGNSVRMEAAGFAKLPILQYLKNIVFVLYFYFYNAIIPIIIPILISLGLFKIIFSNTIFNKFPSIQWTKTRERLVGFIFNFKWFFVAVSTVIPFIIVPGLLANRTLVFFLYFVFFFVLDFCFKLFLKSFICRNLNNVELQNKNLLPFYSIMVVLVTSLIFITYNLQKGILLKRAIAQRENIFKKSKGKTVHVKLINQELSSPCYHFSDFFIDIPDENNYVKTTQELFFDVKIIIEK